MVKLIPARDVGMSTGRRRARRLATGCYSWLVCCPPVLPADTRAKRLADRLLPRSGWPEAAYFAAIAALLGLAGWLPARSGLAVTGLACLGGGAWCAVNFWRCRHAHCLITGIGWLALGVVALTGAGLGHSLLDGADRLAFLGVLAVGVLFEATIYLTRGNYTLAPTPDARHNGSPNERHVLARQGGDHGRCYGTCGSGPRDRSVGRETEPTATLHRGAGCDPATDDR